MKKTVIIAILIIYLGSLVIVNFFGLKIKNFEGTKYVENIDCQISLRRDEDAEVKTYADPMDENTTWYVFNFTPGIYGADEESSMTNPNMIIFSPHVYPENADNTRVNFLYDKTAAEGICVFFEKSMSLCFLKPGGITLTIEAADGSNVKQTMFIYAQPVKTPAA